MLWIIEMEEVDKKMSGDQDECEWVNVSSGTSLLGIDPDKRPLNVL